MGQNLILCDTDVIIDYLDESQIRHSQTKRTIEEELHLSNVVISIITKMELLIGAQNKSEKAKIERNISGLNLMHLNEQISRQAFNLLRKYHLEFGLLIPDYFIASTSIVADIALFTYNKKDSQFIKQLKLFTP